MYGVYKINFHLADCKDIAPDILDICLLCLQGTEKNSINTLYNPKLSKTSVLQEVKATLYQEVDSQFPLSPSPNSWIIRAIIRAKVRKIGFKRVVTTIIIQCKFSFLFIGQKPTT